MKRQPVLPRFLICVFILQSLAGCAGFFTRSTTPTTAYKPVHQHALGGDIAELREAVKKDPASVNLGDANGNTPLNLAAFHGHTEAVRFLLGHGAIINKPNNQRQTALILAAKAGQKQVVDLLLHAGANPAIRDARGWNAEEWAQRQGYTDLAREIHSFHR